MFNPLGGGRVQDSTDNKMMGKNSFSRYYLFNGRLIGIRQQIPEKCIVLDSTNKTTSFKFPLVFRGGLKIP